MILSVNSDSSPTIVNLMTRNTRTYGHFCTLAGALEQLGDRWTLLVVRDLMSQPRRFTDLMDRLVGITPKTLSHRLKELETHGIVQSDRAPGRREVWYELTPAGRDLAPAIEELFLWGLHHARRLREPGEPAHPEHLLTALRIVLERTHALRTPTRWRFRFLDDGTYTLASDGDRWTLAPTDTVDADVVITTTTEVWANYLIRAPSSRPTEPDGIEISGTRRAITAFRRAIAAFPDGAS
jgi:DNA-binding HxlR family transcriptional regulator